MATNSDVRQVGAAPVLVLITDPEWEEHLLAWAAEEAELRHSDVRVFRTGEGGPNLDEAWRGTGNFEGGLIVVGQVGPGVLSDLLFGPASERFRSAVAVVRPTAPGVSGHGPRTRTITVGFHGSASAEAALRWALAEAMAREAAVQAVLAWSENPYGPAEGAVGIDPHLHSLPGVHAASLVETTVAATGVESSQVRPVARRGTPARVLADEAAGSDLLVVGAGQSSIHSRQICGVTTLGCVSRSPVPVVIVPFPAGPKPLPLGPRTRSDVSIRRRSSDMQASIGDRIIIRGHHVGEPDRDGEILEVRGSEGAPPYLVRWDDGHEGLFFPGPDASIQHFSHANRNS